MTLRRCGQTRASSETRVTASVTEVLHPEGVTAPPLRHPDQPIGVHSAEARTQAASHFMGLIL